MSRLMTAQWLRSLALLAALATLAGCSGIQTMYQHGDLYLEWKANQFFDLDRAQEQALKPAIDSLLRWHRQNELPAYVHMLQTVQTKLVAGATPDDVRWLNEEARSRLRASILHTATVGAPILATVTPQQIENLQKRLTKENEDFFDKYAREPMGKQQTERASRFIDNLEFWVGSLSSEQKARIKQIAAEAPTLYVAQLAERERIQREFIALISEKNSADTLKARLAAWIAGWDAGHSPEFAEAARISTEQTLRMSMSVIETMTLAQRERAQKTLQYYIDAMKALAAEAR